MSVRTRFVIPVPSAQIYLDLTSVSVLQVLLVTHTRLDVEALMNAGLIGTVVPLWLVWLIPEDTGNVSTPVTSLSVDLMLIAMLLTINHSVNVLISTLEILALLWDVLRLNVRRTVTVAETRYARCPTTDA